MSTNHTSFIHDSLPAVLAEDWIVADVEFAPADHDAILETGARARVRRMVQGKYTGDTLIVRPGMITSCSHPFENGNSGLIVAIPVGMEAGLLVVDPIEVSRSSGYRLGPGFRLPNGFLSRPVVSEDDQKR